MNNLTNSRQLHRRVQHWIENSTPGSSPEPFERLALDLARFQRDMIPPIARLFSAHDFDPEQQAALDELPAVPCDAFRLRRLAAHPPEQDECCFLTSGSTGGPMARGQHPMRTTATYRVAALNWGRHWLWPDRPHLNFIGLVPQEHQAPDSSLSFMLARFADTLSGWVSWHADEPTLNLPKIAEACQRSFTTKSPALVAGTSFAFVHLCEQTQPGDLRLPPQSRIMQTGGFKGRSREIDADSLRSMIATRFGLREDHVVAEYGMTELSSQLYQGNFRASLGLNLPPGQPSLYFPPPWMRITAVDPITLETQAPGAMGIARIIDLANVDSAVAIQTADHIIVHEGGGVQLLGRQAGAPPRGCSLAMEHLLDEL